MCTITEPRISHSSAVAPLSIGDGAQASSNGGGAADATINDDDGDGGNDGTTLFSFGMTHPSRLAAQQGGGPKRSLGLRIPAEKTNLLQQDRTTRPELTKERKEIFLDFVAF